MSPTTKKDDDTKGTTTKAKTTAKKDEGLGEHAYAGEPVEWEDDRENAPGTASHLGGDAPYAGAEWTPDE
jgi:hypothetical protein